MFFSSFYRKYPTVVAIVVLMAIGLWFSWDLATLKKYLNHPEYVDYYPSYRTWFFQQIKTGHFPVWNPHWGLGHSSEIEASFPIDIYSLIEGFIGPNYHWFYPIQAAGILLASFWAVRILSGSVPLAFLASVLFFFSPWVTYFFFYWIKANSFIGIWLSFAFGYRYLKDGASKDAFLLSLSTALALSGTKLDFWFFHFVFLGSLPLLFFWIEPPRRNLSRGLIYLGALALGLGCHAWQLIPMVQILRQSSRLGEPLGFFSFTNGDFYFRLILSIVSSAFLKIALLCGCILSGISKSGKSQRNILVGSLLLFVLLKAWGLPPLSSLFSYYGLGAAIAIGYLRLFKKAPISHLFKQLLLFLPLAYYWCRPIPQDLNEMTIMLKAPTTLQAVWGFLVFLSMGTLRNSFSKLLYGFICLIFFYRDQGQVVLAHLFGLVWMPTRDNFLLDLLFSLLAISGLMTTFRRPLLPALILSMLVVIPCSKNFYYPHPLIANTPPGYPYTKGRREILDALKSLRLRPESRVYFADREIPKNLSVYGSSLLTGINQVHAFSSFMPARYHDWTAYQWFGFDPKIKWSAYQGEYSYQTIEKLPPRNSMGIPTNLVYWWALHAMPPPTLNSLRLFGVERILSEAPLGTTPTELVREKRVGPFFTADVPSPLSRAFLTQIEESQLKLWQEALNPISDSNKITIEKHHFPVEAIPIAEYGRENVRIETNSKEDRWLVLTDLYHPFWQVTVDGESREMLPALGLFRMVRVPKGQHRIVFKASIPGFPFGVKFSMLCLCLMVCGLIMSSFPFLHRKIIIGPKNYFPPSPSHI